MDFNEYQMMARTTRLESAKLLQYAVLGLASEAGEVAGVLKKYLRDTNQSPTTLAANMAGELGDVLWYVAAICDDLGLEMKDVAQANIKKLADRQARNAIQGSGDNR